MAFTYAERLESIQNAIVEIEGGAQSYAIGDRSWTGADLDTLYKQEKILRQLANREARGGGIRVRGITPVS